MFTRLVSRLVESISCNVNNNFNKRFISGDVSRWESTGNHNDKSPRIHKLHKKQWF